MNRFVLIVLAFGCTLVAAAQTVTVGSKKFTESYVLGEIAKKTLERAGFTVDHRQGIGATGLVWAALQKGDIDAYPEYTGTIAEELLKEPDLSPTEMGAKLQKLGIGMSPELGFNDAYGLVMRRAEAARLGIKRISDLTSHPKLRPGITPELISRKDGWGPLTRKYGLGLPEPRAIEHGLGYAALHAGQIDIKDCYTTDAEIQRYDLVVLQDDRQFFPLYRAVFLYQLSMDPKAIAALATLAGKISEPKMIAMNAEANESGDYARAASALFTQAPRPTEKPSLATETLRLSGQHLLLVGISLLLSIGVGLPLGIRAAKGDRAGGWILAGVGVIQTIPSLALLTLLVSLPFFGIGTQTAIAALFLYGLLPIVRNTATGLQGIPASLRESAAAIGLPPRVQLRRVFLPMAMPTVLAGIKTSAVINVGTATIAALIGAEGLGKPIVSGLSRNDNATVLQGAIPAAILALLVQWGFEQIERRLVPRGLKG